MRFDLRSVVAVGMVAALASPAWAQQQQRTPAPRGAGAALGGFNLITVPAVQKELKLDDAQVKKADALAERMKQRFGVDRAKLKGLSPDEQLKRLPTVAGPHYEEGMKGLRGFLRPEQVDRFDQILFQQRGPIAMLEPKIAQTLQITNEQAQKVAELFAQARNEQRAAVQAAGKDQGAAVVKVESIAADANIKAAGLLSPEQRRTWTRLTGEPFRPDLAGGAKPADDATPKR